MNKRIPVLALIILALSAIASAQKADVTITLNEAFFDSFLDSVYRNFDPPKFNLADDTGRCEEHVKILRALNGVRTGARFRDGKMYVPLAFSGRYDAPLIGCVDFSGTADSVLSIDLDRENQRLAGRVKVGSVNLTGTGGIGGSLVARMLQGTIDRKINPLEIIKLDKMGFTIPVLDRGQLGMQATSARADVNGNALSITVTYQFVKP